jgi:hypothetical protein
MRMYSSLVDVAEMNDSPQEKWQDGRLTATVRLMVPWDSRNLLVADIVGGYQLYPRLPQSGARATGATITPVPNSAAAALPFMADACNYEYALVTIEYVRNESTPETVDLISESLSPTSEFLTLDPKSFRWDKDGNKPLKEGEAPGKLVRGLEYSITQHKVLYIPAACLTLPGCCNNAPYFARLLGLTFPAETLLYSPPHAERKITSNPDDPPYWQLSHSLSFKPDGWNKTWNAETGRYEQLYVARTKAVYKNHPPASFSGVLP